MRRALKITGIGCGGFIALILLITVLGIVFGHNSNKDKNAKKSAATSTTKSATKPKSTKRSLPKGEQEARAYISYHGLDIDRVQANVVDAEVAVGEAIRSPTVANVDQLAQTAQTAHDNLDSIRQDFALHSSDPGELGNAELNAFSGANDLKNSMGAIVAYTGAPSPATLASFTTQFRRAKAEWNSGMRVIYELARRRHPPTV